MTWYNLFKNYVNLLLKIYWIFVIFVIVLYDCSAQTSNAICGSVLSTLDIHSINKVVVVVYNSLCIKQR